MSEELSGLGLLDYPSLIHEYDPVGHRFGETDLVRHAEHRHAVRRKATHDIEHFADHLRIQRSGRLVEQHNTRLHGKGAGNGDALLLPTRKLIRKRCFGATFQE